MAMAAFDIGDNVGYPNIYRDPGETGRSMTVIDREVCRHRNGSIFIRYLLDGLMDRLVEDMHDNVTNHYDNVVIVTGKEGSGKSNFAYELCKKFDPDFNLKQGYIYDFEPFIERIAEGEDLGQVFWMDEATNLASNRDWMKQDNKSLIQILEMMRSRGWTLVMCIPQIERLDVYVRENRVRYLVNCIEKSWDNDTVQKRGYFELKVPRYQGFDTVGYGKFSKMDPAASHEYEQLKLSSQKSKIAEIRENNDRRKGSKKDQERNAALARMAETLNGMGYTYDDLADLTGMTRGQLAGIVHRVREEDDREDY